MIISRHVNVAEAALMMRVLRRRRSTTALPWLLLEHSEFGNAPFSNGGSYIIIYFDLYMDR